MKHTYSKVNNSIKLFNASHGLKENITVIESVKKCIPILRRKYFGIKYNLNGGQS